MDAIIQTSVFFGLTALVALITWLHCRKAERSTDSTREYFLAGGGLNWMFIAGSITLTNINTDTFVGMNGDQTLVIAWWELSGFVGLLILAKVFVPLYYRYNCTTVTELLERRYDNKHIRATVGGIFLVMNVFLFLPAMLYTSSLVLRDMFGLPATIQGVDTLLVISVFTAAVGAAYAVFGGLRAVAISDTYAGVIVLSFGLLAVFLSLDAIGWDFSGIPPERLTLIGDSNSAIPWPTLFTGMIFSQLFYWSTNQTITQRALAAPSIREARKGVYAAALVRILIIPAMMAIPGVCAYKLFGDVNDAAYGMLVGKVFPSWLRGAFAASMFGAVMTSYNAMLNSSAALYVCDLHQNYRQGTGDIRRLSIWISLGFAVLSIAIMPFYAGAPSIMARIQALLGAFSMPILSAFITGLAFRNVDARAVIATIFFGTGLYAFFTFGWSPLHFLHLMAITVCVCVGFALALNRVAFGRRATFVFATAGSRREIWAILKS
jgi:SSS family solute:Na+ symporter